MEKEYDLTDVEQAKDLEKDSSKKDYFSFQEGISYKLKLNSNKIRSLQKEFEDKTVTKYVIDCNIKTPEGVVHDGELEVGPIITSVLASSSVEGNLGSSFGITRTGTGIKTRYNIVRDF